MKTRIGKDFYWEMSHRLQNHDGLCRNIHGHSYKMRVELEGYTDETGMVMDYYILATIVNPVINDLDHSFICHEGDSLMINFLRENNFKYKIIPYFSTAENICSYIISQISGKIGQNKNITALKVRIYETSDVFAEQEVKYEEK